MYYSVVALIFKFYRINKCSTVTVTSTITSRFYKCNNKLYIFIYSYISKLSHYESASWATWWDSKHFLSCCLSLHLWSSSLLPVSPAISSVFVSSAVCPSCSMMSPCPHLSVLLAVFHFPAVLSVSGGSVVVPGPAAEPHCKAFVWLERTFFQWCNSASNILFVAGRDWM